jgi:hypothetical protein
MQCVNGETNLRLACGAGRLLFQGLHGRRSVTLRVGRGPVAARRQALERKGSGFLNPTLVKCRHWFLACVTSTRSPDSAICFVGLKDNEIM